MKKKLSEVHLPGGNFYSGRHLGTSGADSNFSSYISNKKSFPLHSEEEDEQEEGMKNSILSKRKRTASGAYRLEATIDSINEEASQTGIALEKALSDLLQGAADEATGETAGLLLVVPVAAKNLYEMYTVGKDVDALFDLKRSNMSSGEVDVFDFTSEDIAQMNQLKVKQASDLTEFFSAIIRALPVPAGVDSAIAGFINQISTPFGTKLSDLSQMFMGSLPSMLRTVVKFSAAPVGGPIIYDTMKRIYMISNLKPGTNKFEAGSGNLVSDMPASTLTPPGAMMSQDTGGLQMQGDDIYMPTPEEFKKGLDRVFKQTVSESLKYKSLGTILQEFNDGAVCEQCGGTDGIHESGCANHEADQHEGVCEQCGMSDGVHESGCANHENEVTEAGCGTHESDCNEGDVTEVTGAGGIAGVQGKLGHNPDGTPTTYAQLSKLRKKQDIFNITENQNWNHKTLGKIKFN